MKKVMEIFMVSCMLLLGVLSCSNENDQEYRTMETLLSELEQQECSLVNSLLWNKDFFENDFVIL